MSTWMLTFGLAWFVSNFGAVGIVAIGATALAYAFGGPRWAIGVGVILVGLLFGVKAAMAPSKAAPNAAAAKAQAEAKKRAARQRWNKPAEKAIDSAAKNAMSHLGGAGGGGMGGGMGGGFGGSTPVNIPHAPTHGGGGGIQFVPRVEAAGPPSISTRTMGMMSAPPTAAAIAPALSAPVNHQADDDDSQPVSRDMVKNLVGAANLKAAASQAATANAAASTNAAQPANAAKAKPTTAAPLVGGGGNQPATSHSSGITPSVGHQTPITGKSLADQAKAAAIQVVPPQKTDAASTANTAPPVSATIGGFGNPNAKPTSPSTPPSGDTAPAPISEAKGSNHTQAMPPPGDGSANAPAAATPHKQVRYKPHYTVTDPDKLAEMQMKREMRDAMPYSPSHGNGFGGGQPAASNAASHKTHHYASTDPNGIDRHGNPIHHSGGMNPLSPMPNVQPGAIVQGNPGIQHGPTQHPGGYQQPMGGQHPGFNPMHSGGMGMPQMPMGQHPFGGGGFGPMHSGQAATHATHGGHN